MVASHYTRTSGDPIAATCQCLEALVKQVGDRCVGLWERLAMYTQLPIIISTVSKARDLWAERSSCKVEWH